MPSLESSLEPAPIHSPDCMPLSNHPFALLLTLVTLGSVGCDTKKEVAKKAPEKAAAQKDDDSKPSKATADGPVSELTFMTMLSDEARRGMSAPKLAGAPVMDQIAALKEKYGDTRKSQGTPLPFTRLVGGEGFYCGTLKNGPVRCWGRRDDYMPGGFIDVAVAGHEICAVQASGGVRCVGKIPLPFFKIKRIAGGGSHFCTLSRSGEVACFNSDDGEASLTPPPGLKARYLAVAHNFACAANHGQKLECWGPGVPKDAPLGTRIKDLASTQMGMCLLDEDDHIQCFGTKIDVSSASYSAINGGFGTICGKRKDQDITECRGRVEKTYDKPSQRLAVAAETVCALTPDGSPDCIGLSFGPEVAFPRAKAPEPLTEKDPLFDEFLALFPKGKLPFEMTRESKFQLGPQVPEKFYNFLSNHPAKFRVVAQFDAPAPTVVVFDWDFGNLELYTYDKLGNMVRHRTLATIGAGWNGRDAMVLADGQSIDESSYHSKESVLLPGGKLKTTTYDRYNTSHYLAPKPGEAFGPLNYIECVISGAKSVDQIKDDGVIARLSAERLPSHAETDKDGCGKMWPHK
jgi:hypothetical protein